MSGQPPFPAKSFLAPRYWLTWLTLALLWCAARAPHPIRLRLGRGLGHFMRLVMLVRRHIVETNLRLCFPDMRGADRTRLVRKNFESLGMTMIETAMSWWLSDEALRGMASVEGVEHLQDAVEAGQGVILLSAHFTTLEIGGRLLVPHAHFHVMYREHKNPLFEEVMRRARERSFDKAIKREDIRGMLRSLKQGKPVWYAPDQNYGREHSVFIPFFDFPTAATITATSRLAKMSGAQVVPFFQRRLDDGRYRLTILPPLEGFPGEDGAADALRINRLIEAQIKTMPEQYLWAHRRFKTRPEGESGVY
ncbi:lipid A biosynthesis lauroyl acyltransferase [Solemya pervernicosa gill symbiont]|uniref:Lipid A biosynthesis acyltransferase n=2 Tax=Gammaproteobacteria incertae sedis TaxID=118884 RepID=A0A1T2L0A5_9GAMM|nr:LpxL/LpxP family Kdo(2)-lipid IV(A) lauroyl/palmitoleoyl acyltransferase [Candidatus Reidiella endopervernicosa]OOZ38450.1 lipid A biosynthesis lauroyl acyltransferase [Solemya pervernicosa gill symbiont]QKQ27880.1 LpxL/LpxP family Kdo(2)-lipid IV(A) lauroyl/palmitoleoyl acyltransferase [Candidatus Reidiella endopervernicosa]